MKKGLDVGPMMESIVDQIQAALEPVHEPKALAPLMDNNALDPWDDTVEGTVQAAFPLLKIAYENSKGKPDDCAVGQLFNSATGEVKDVAKFIWLNTKSGNVLRKPYDPKAEQQAPILCKSNNGMVPTGGVEPMPGPCRRKLGTKIIDACPKLKWMPDPKNPGKQVPPECSGHCIMLGYDLEGDVPFLFVVKRTALKHFRALKTRMRALKGAMADRERPDIPGFLRTPVTISSKKVGIYFEPNFDILMGAEHRVPVEWAEAMKEQAALWSSQLDRLDMDDVTDADVESPAANGDSFQVMPNGEVL